MPNDVGVFRKTHLFYKKRVLPSVKHLRGATRLDYILGSLADWAGERPKYIQGEPKGIDDFEWDNLVILDACRLDLYQQVTGNDDFRITGGSHSADFVKYNFSQGDYDDVVVVTANPHYMEDLFIEETGRKPSEVFHEVFHTYENRWDDEKGTVMPGDLCKDVRTASKLFPEKRILVHFMQPHIPFLSLDLETKGFSHLLDDSEAYDFWDLAWKEKFSKEEIFEHYSQNLELVLDEVEGLSEVLSGRTVITSDHGNLVGESGLYGHPRNSRYEHLRKVPFDKRDW